MRQTVIAQDIMLFFNKQNRQAYKIIASIKKHYNKKNYQPVTINDFVDYYKIEKQNIESIIAVNDAKKKEKLAYKQKIKQENAAINQQKIKDNKEKALQKLEEIENRQIRFTHKTAPLKN